MTERMTIYKTDEYTLQLVTDESGVVLDCEITFKSTSEFARRIQQRTRRYKSDLKKRGADELNIQTDAEI